MRGTVTRIGDYCFDSRVLGWFLLGAAAVVLFAPPVLQAAALMVVGTCPVTSVAGICKAAKLHQCMDQRSDRRRQDEGDEGSELRPGPYAGLVTGMFGRRN